MFFHFSIIISPWKRVGPLLWTNLNPLYPRMLCAKFGWNWLSGSGEEDFLNFVNLFLLFLNYLPLEKGGGGPSFEQTWIPFTQGCFVPTLVEIGPVVLEKKTFKYFQHIFTFSLLSSLGKGRGTSFEQTWIPSNQGCFVPSWN